MSVLVILPVIGAMYSVDFPGGIIILEINANNYSLSEISHIVESNDASVISSYITSRPDSAMMEVTLKINKTDLTRILASFYRHNYDVKASYHESEFTDELKNRSDYLMNYLNM